MTELVESRRREQGVAADSDANVAHDSPQLERFHELKRLRRLCRMMDEAFVIPGTRFRIGLDSVVGLVPLVGDGVTALVSGYIIFRARKMGARKRTIAKMCGHVGLDTFGGAVPLAGDIFDAGYKCNLKNLRLLEKDLQRRASKQQHVDAD